MRSLRNFVIRVIINAVAIALTATLLPGINIANAELGTLLFIGLVFGIVNAIIKPILLFMSCPMVLLTLGLFILVINGLLLQLVAWLVGDSLIVDGFGWAVLGGLIMSIVITVFERFMGLEKARAVRTMPRKRKIPRV